MERLTAKALAKLPKEKTFARAEWSRKPERHEEFAVRGSTNLFHHNAEASRIVLSCMRKFPEEEGEGLKGCSG